MSGIYAKYANSNLKNHGNDPDIKTYVITIQLLLRSIRLLTKMVIFVNKMSLILKFQEPNPNQEHNMKSKLIGNSRLNFSQIQLKVAI